MFVTTPRELAHGLNQHLRLGLTPRPWNIHSPDEFYWLVPSTVWPAYRYGKFAFAASRSVPRRDLNGADAALVANDTIFAGFNLEKGYGPLAVNVDQSLRRRPAQIIDSTWLWPELITGAGPESVDRILRRAVGQAPLFLYVTSGYVHDQEDRGRHPHDVAMFACSVQGINIAAKNAFPVGVLLGGEKATTFVELASLLENIDDYHWVDVYIGTFVQQGDVDLFGLHDRVLSFVSGWLK
jgi:hypothetical protein